MIADFRGQDVDVSFYNISQTIWLKLPQ